MPESEEPGIAILAALLEQFPVIATVDEEENYDEPRELAMPSANVALPLHLETWIIETVEALHINEQNKRPVVVTEMEIDPASDESESACMLASQSAFTPIAGHASVAGKLQTLPLDGRTPAIQIGFDFAEGEF